MDVLLDNIIFGLQNRGGISVYWSEMLARASGHGLSWIDPFPGMGNSLRELVATAPLKHPSFSLPVKLERYCPVRCTQLIVHSSYYRVPAESDVKLVTSVYDFTYEHYVKGPALWVHHGQKMRALKRSQKLLCISESTARDVVQFGGKELAAKIVVTHLAASPEFKLIPDHLLQLKKKYEWFASLLAKKRVLLFVGARNSYKRFDLAVKSTEQYSDGHLIVIGGGAPTKQEACQCKKLTSEGRITFLPAVGTGELPLWYNAAHALFYLSDYEGFGLPVLEASQCGCPVLAQNKSSIPEVYGDREFLLTEVDRIDGIAEKLKQLEVENIKAALVAKCSNHASSFSWDSCWDKTFDVYRSL